MSKKPILEMTKKTIIEISYNDFSKFVCDNVELGLLKGVKLPTNEYNNNKLEYEVACEEEWGNGGSHEYNIKAGETLDDDEREDLKNGELAYSARCIFVAMLEQGLIEPALYQIECSW